MTREEDASANEVVPSAASPTMQPKVSETSEERAGSGQAIVGGESCELNNGGCDHSCVTAKDETGYERIECSCYAGFTLNEADGRTCQGKIPRATI